MIPQRLRNLQTQEETLRKQGDTTCIIALFSRSLLLGLETPLGNLGIVLLASAAVIIVIVLVMGTMVVFLVIMGVSLFRLSQGV